MKGKAEVELSGEGEGLSHPAPLNARLASVSEAFVGRESREDCL